MFRANSPYISRTTFLPLVNKPAVIIPSKVPDMNKFVLLCSTLPQGGNPDLFAEFEAVLTTVIAVCLTLLWQPILILISRYFPLDPTVEL